MPDWIDFNPFWDQVVIGQGLDVQPGAAGVSIWGTPPNTNDTGGHPPYGYRHLHKFKRTAASGYVTLMTPTEQSFAVRAALSLAMCRHVVYFGEDAYVRRGNYYIGGKPYGNLGTGGHAYTHPLPFIPYGLPGSPYLPNDAENGQTLWVPPSGGAAVGYSGLECEHAWTFLDEIVKLQGVTVPLLPHIPGEPATVDAAVLAATRLWCETWSIVGQMYDPFWNSLTNKFGPGGWSDRTVANAIHWVHNAHAVGMMDPFLNDAFIGFLLVANAFAQFPPGGTHYTQSMEFTAQPGTPYVPGDKYFVTVQLAWIAAAFYDIANSLEGSIYPVLQAELRFTCSRLGTWLAEVLPTGGPHNGVMPWAIVGDATVLAGSGGHPHNSLASFLGSGAAFPVWTYDGYSPWCYRALKCAAALGNTAAGTAATAIYALWGTNPTVFEWMVGADKKYVNATAATAAGETVSAY